MSLLIPGSVRRTSTRLAQAHVEHVAHLAASVVLAALSDKE